MIHGAGGGGNNTSIADRLSETANVENTQAAVHLVAALGKGGFRGLGGGHTLNKTHPFCD